MEQHNGPDRLLLTGVYLLYVDDDALVGENNITMAIGEYLVPISSGIFPANDTITDDLSIVVALTPTTVYTKNSTNNEGDGGIRGNGNANKDITPST